MVFCLDGDDSDMAECYRKIQVTFTKNTVHENEQNRYNCACWCGCLVCMESACLTITVLLASDSHLLFHK